jgi:hypothetical protein
MRPNWFGNRLKTLRDERGGVLAFVAVIMVVLLAIAALCIDLAMAYTARGEAQRVADASALAGASVWLDAPPVTDTVGEATTRALDFASSNVVRNLVVDPSRVTVEVLQGERKVRVWVQSQSLGTWFARLLGFKDMHVRAMAAAAAVTAGEATCVKPFVLFDLWDEGGDYVVGGDEDDPVPNNIPDVGEEWAFDDGLEGGTADGYAPYHTDPGVAACTGHQCAEYAATDGTGWGSSFRNQQLDGELQTYDNDVGRKIALKLPNPSQNNDTFEVTPGIYLPWRMPDPDEGCAETGQGGDFYRTNIATCNSCPIELNTDYTAEPGAMIGPTEQGLRDLLDLDPDIVWDPISGTVSGGLGLESPRVVNVAVAAPNQDLQGAAFPIRFNNIVTMFIEDLQQGSGSVIARYMGPAGAQGLGPTQGELTMVLRLVE